MPPDLCQVNGRVTLSSSESPGHSQPPCALTWLGGCGHCPLWHPVLAMPRAWQQGQGVSTISPPRFEMLLCRGPAGAGAAQSRALVSVFSQIRDLEDVAACLEKVLGEIKQLQDVEKVPNCPWSQEVLPKGQRGAATPHPTRQEHTGASLRMFSLEPSGATINTPPCLA